MYEKTGNRTTARILIALLAVALVFTMMPLSMGKVFAEEETVQGLEITGDVVKELKYANMKEMKNNEAIKDIIKKDVPFHGLNNAGTERDVTVDGVVLYDLVTKVAGLDPNAKLFLVQAESTGKKPGTKDIKTETLKKTDLQGNQMMFAWKMVENGKESKVQTLIRGQFTEGEKNMSDWYSDVTKVTVYALGKPAIKVTAGKKKATIKWTAKGYNEGFNILRSTKKNGKYKVIAVLDDDTDPNKYTDKKVKKGKTYYYKVQATAGDMKNDSKVKKVKIKK